MVKVKAKDFGMTVGGATQPQKPKKGFMTKGKKKSMMAKSAPKR